MSTNNQVLFCLLYKHTDSDFFDDFSKISYHFPEISEESPNIIRRLQERVRTISENNRRLPKTFEEDPQIFRSYNNKFKYSLRVKHNINEVIDIFASEDMENKVRFRRRISAVSNSIQLSAAEMRLWIHTSHLCRT